MRGKKQFFFIRGVSHSGQWQEKAKEGNMWAVKKSQRKIRLLPILLKMYIAHGMNE